MWGRIRKLIPHERQMTFSPSGGMEEAIGLMDSRHCGHSIIMAGGVPFHWLLIDVSGLPGYPDLKLLSQMNDFLNNTRTDLKKAIFGFIS